MISVDPLPVEPRTFEARSASSQSKVGGYTTQSGSGGAISHYSVNVAPKSKPPDNSAMEKRVEALEKDVKDVLGRLARVETKLDAKADKSDLSEAKLHLVMLGAGAWVSLLFVLAKGFKWF